MNSIGFPDEELHRHFNELENEIDIHLYGRRMYKIMAGYWPTVDRNPSAPAHEIECARIWREKPKIVFSTALEEVGWNSRFVKENIAEELRKLKAQPGKNMSVGGAGITSTFMKLTLINEFRLYVCPIILGGGKPLFQPLDGKINLRLV